MVPPGKWLPWHRRLKRQHKIETTRENRAVVRGSQTIILAVKPQNMAAVLDEIRPEVNHEGPKKPVHSSDRYMVENNP